MKEVTIATNMLALAKKKGGNKRSLMLRMVMPFLSREDGDALADSIDSKDTAKFNRTWNVIRQKIEHKLAASSHKAHASAEADDFEPLIDQMDAALRNLVV